MFCRVCVFQRVSGIFGLIFCIIPSCFLLVFVIFLLGIGRFHVIFRCLFLSFFHGIQLFGGEISVLFKCEKFVFQNDFCEVGKGNLPAAERAQIFQLRSGFGQQCQFFNDDPVSADTFQTLFFDQVLHSGIIHGHKRMLQIKVSFHFL